MLNLEAFFRVIQMFVASEDLKLLLCSQRSFSLLERTDTCLLEGRLVASFQLMIRLSFINERLISSLHSPGANTHPDLTRAGTKPHVVERHCFCVIISELIKELKIEKSGNEARLNVVPCWGVDEFPSSDLFSFPQCLDLDILLRDTGLRRKSTPSSATADTITVNPTGDSFV